MRTTVTLDPDTEALLRAEVRRTGLSFKQVLNLSVRRAIVPQALAGRRISVQPIFAAPFPPEFGTQSLNHIAEELEDEDTLRELAE